MAAQKKLWIAPIFYRLSVRARNRTSLKRTNFSLVGVMTIFILLSSVGGFFTHLLNTLSPFLQGLYIEETHSSNSIKIFREIIAACFSL